MNDLNSTNLKRNPSEIDKLIEIISKSEEVTLATPIFIQFCEKILDSIGEGQRLWNDEPVNSLFNERFGQSQKRFIAICLLRLYSAKKKLFEHNRDFRVRVFKLFDEVLEHDIYKILKIDPRDQTFNKETRLQGLASDIERELNNLITQFNNLNLLPDFRHNFMKQINNQLYKAFLHPFLPSNLYGLRLNEIFKLTEEYLNASENDLNKFQAFNEVKKALEEYQREAQKFDTRYSKYFENLAQKLLDLIKKDFKKNSFTKPAEIVVKKLEKKYPFHIINREFGLNFTVQNHGLGCAFDIKVKFDATITLKKREFLFDQLNPSQSVEIDIPCIVETEEEKVIVEAQISWSNFDSSIVNRKFEFELEAQRRDIDWETLDKEDPYSLEPVTNEEDFVGRREILDQLESILKSQNVGSVFIWGQKRVGKTSVVKTLKTRVEKNYGPEVLVIFLEGGDYINPDPEITIKNLGYKLCERIRNSNRRFANLEIPKFDNALSPLADFLEAVTSIAPDLKILFILDEFDELPAELYSRESLGKAFFLTLRSISGKAPFGFILVGSEKMEIIINFHGVELNKFQPIRIDYFDREQHWRDFQDLVKRPIKKWFEISDRAISTLYNYTAGNPYFTKQICKQLFTHMVKRRDCDITHKEMEEAIKEALRNAEVNTFVHFWEDGIFEIGVKAEEISINRRKLLLAFAETLRKNKTAEKSKIIKNCEQWGISDFLIENELREFERRHILVVKDDTYKCKVLFFEEWLKENGIRKIITTISKHDEFLKQKEKEEKERVTSEEIIILVKSFGVYKGKQISPELVRVWLNQFGDYRSQRLMFTILQNLKFYSADNIRAKMKEAHGIVVRGLIDRSGIDKRKREDILVSHLDKVGKSSSYLCRIYAEENNVYYTNIIERGQITEALKEKAQKLKAFALVFIDDFIGTGDSACEYFKDLLEQHGEILKRLTNESGELEGTTRLQIFYLAISGFQQAQVKVERFLDEIELPVKVHICDPLGESDRVFSEQSQIFKDPSIRHEAQKIAYEKGFKLVKNAPLGYGDCQAAVVFEHNCPNNSLPILWAESKNWVPLFKRG